MKKDFLITDEVGLHARPATLLVNEASKYVSDVKIILGEKEANLKSIMGAMSLGVTKDATISISAEGEDAEQALEGIANVFVEAKLGEEK
jgi:phosphocarrier protein